MPERGQIDVRSRKWEGDRSVLGTWNTPEAIAENRNLSAEERVKRMVELSNAPLKFSRAERVDSEGES